MLKVWKASTWNLRLHYFGKKKKLFTTPRIDYPLLNNLSYFFIIITFDDDDEEEEMLFWLFPFVFIFFRMYLTFSLIVTELHFPIPFSAIIGKWTKWKVCPDKRFNQTFSGQSDNPQMEISAASGKNAATELQRTTLVKKTRNLHSTWSSQLNIKQNIVHSPDITI